MVLSSPLTWGLVTVYLENMYVMGCMCLCIKGGRFLSLQLFVCKDVFDYISLIKVESTSPHEELEFQWETLSMNDRPKMFIYSSILNTPHPLAPVWGKFWGGPFVPKMYKYSVASVLDCNLISLLHVRFPRGICEPKKKKKKKKKKREREKEKNF